MSTWTQDINVDAPGHKKGITSEQAMRRALGELHGWDDPNGLSARGSKRAGIAKSGATKPRQSPTKIDKHNFPLSPDMVPGSHKMGRTQKIPVALPAGTRLNVWWSGEDEPFECEVIEWRLVSAEDDNAPPSYVHRCQYEGGVISHDLTQIVFEIVPGTMASSLLKEQAARNSPPGMLSPPEDLPAPSSPIKGNVISRGKVAVWEQPLATPKASSRATGAAPQRDQSSQPLAEAKMVTPPAPAPVQVDDDDEDDAEFAC